MIQLFGCPLSIGANDNGLKTSSGKLWIKDECFG